MRIRLPIIEPRQLVICSAFVLGTLLLAGCMGVSCELDYYERVSGVDLPESTSVIECMDNGEFITAAILDIPREEVAAFLEQQQFEKVPSDYQVDFAGMYFLDLESSDFPPVDHLYLREGHSQKNTWYFLLDMQTGRLWAEVSYPDWGGTPPSFAPTLPEN